jgi:hypothetical protein
MRSRDIEFGYMRQRDLAAVACEDGGSVVECDVEEHDLHYDHDESLDEERAVVVDAEPVEDSANTVVSVR